MSLRSVSYTCPADSVQTIDATPPLPGKFAVGLRHFHAIDTNRDDASTGSRQFMVSAFYPAQPNLQASRARLRDLYQPAAAEVLSFLKIEEPEKLARTGELAYRAQPDLAPHGGTFPVLIYYPGGQGHRLSNAGLCESLASQGYIVFTLEAPRDAPIMVLPNGQIVTAPMNDDEDYIWPRVSDIRFLLDELPHLDSRQVGALDLDKIGMFGASRGGYLANICAVEDDRIRAAVNMDGFLWGLWAEGTGLQEYPQEFQAKARALKTPMLRLKGQQPSPQAVRKIFDLESADFGGDFHLVALDGFEHKDFARTPWLCGELDNLADSLQQEPPDAAGTQTLLTLLQSFFDTYLTQPKVGGGFLTSPPPGCTAHSRTPGNGLQESFSE